MKYSRLEGAEQSQSAPSVPKGAMAQCPPAYAPAGFCSPAAADGGARTGVVVQPHPQLAALLSPHLHSVCKGDDSAAGGREGADGGPDQPLHDKLGTVRYSMAMTMVDTKVVNAVTSTSSQICAMCGATPATTNTIPAVSVRPVTNTQYRLSTLHSWIRGGTVAEWSRAWRSHSS